MTITLILLLTYLLCTIYKFNYSMNNPFFMSPQYSKTMKGLCCIPVIFVHIPLTYSNPIQDLIGSFGYICVTLFFFFSASGLQWNLENTPNYLKFFVRNRSITLFIPYILSCILKYAFGFGIGSGGTHFIYVLILFYIIFYLTNKFLSPHVAFIFTICSVFFYSIISFFLAETTLWSVEALGFAYGLIFSKYKTFLINIMNRHYFLQTGILCFSSLILGLLYSIWKSIFFWGDFILRIILGLCIISFILQLTVRITLQNKLSYALGTISYEVFLLHGFILNFLSSIDNSLHLSFSSDLYIALTFLLSIPLASIFHLLCLQLIKRFRAS